MLAGSLEIQLIANMARLQADMATARSTVQNTVSQINRVLGTLGVGLSFAGLAAGMAMMVRASEDAAQSQRKLDAVLRATGNASGYTADKLSKLADQLARASSFDDEGFREATATLLRFGNIGGANLEKVLKLSADYAALTGGTLSSAAETLGKALNNPAEGLKRLERNFGDLGKETEAAIKLQMDMGNQAGALGVAIEALQKKIGGADETMNAGLTGSMKQLRKAFSELFELGGEAVNNGFFTGMIDDLSAKLRGLKALLEQGTWTEKLAAIGAVLNGNMSGAMLSMIGNAGGAAITPDSSGGGAGFSLADQTERAMAHLRKVVDANAKAADEVAAQNRRLRDLDAAGWVRHIEAMQKEDEESLLAMAKNAEEYYEQKDELRRMEYEGQLWLAQNVVKITEREQDEILRIERAVAEERARQQAAVWNEIGDVAGNFFSDLVMNGKSAFDNLKKWVKQLLADMIALFAKRWVLNLAAGGSVMGSAGSAAAGGLGDGSISSNMLGTAFSAGAGIYSGFTGASALAAAEAAGTLTTSSIVATGGTSLSSVGLGAELYSALAAVPVWGWVLAAVAAVGIFLAGRGGGPKPGGSFMGDYDAAGNFIGTSTVPGTDNGRFFTPSSGDAAMQEFTTQVAGGFFNALTRFGGTTGGLSFGFGFDQDPQGTADSRVSSMVRDAAGNIIYSNTATAGRDNEDFQRAMELETQRAIVAGLQASELPASIALIFDEIDPLTATAEQLAQAFVDADLGMSILALNINGLDFQTLQNFQANGETLEQTFQRVGGAWSWFQENFTTDAERLDRAQQQVTDVFASLGIEIPASLTDFRLLVEGIDLSTEAGRTLWSTLMGVAPAFLLVTQSADSATTAIEDTSAALEEQAELQRRIEESVRDSRLRQLDDIVGARSGLRGFMDGLLLDQNLTVLTPQERLAEAQRQYESVLQLAMGGDLGAAGRLGGAADTYLQIARELFASSSGYVDIFNRVTGQVSGVDARLAIDEQMLRATLGMAADASAQTELLIDVKSLLIEIRDKPATATAGTYEPR